MDENLSSDDQVDARRASPTAFDIIVEHPSNAPLHFGDYRVLHGSRTLMRLNHVVPLGSRAFDLLVALLRSRGRLVSKEDIIREVWPSTFVDESNLRFQMAVLRKALGSERDWIKTIPGRGYLFVEDEGEALLEASPTAAARAPVAALHAACRSVILIIEPDADERNAMTMLLRALKVSVLSFTSVDEVAAFAGSPLRLAAS